MIKKIYNFFKELHEAYLERERVKVLKEILEENRNEMVAIIFPSEQSVMGEVEDILDSKCLIFDDEKGIYYHIGYKDIRDIRPIDYY